MLSRRLILLSLASLAACGGSPHPLPKPDQNIPLHRNETPQLRALINKYSDHYEVPRSLTHRVIQRESRYHPSARNGPYYGLMQILPQTARGMGFRGSPSDLLDAETNLKYGVKYLRGAWLVSDGSQDRAMTWYARGYYYEAKKRGLLKQTGLR
ncbi:transglycosylase SLT domain-containing protein [Thioclava sp.]|uniref:transglycosylase SLT domain-containing protein n=1 Tax=Thioclava sp. TaxID=1933450 RepID=UPI003AA8EE70